MTWARAAAGSVNLSGAMKGGSEDMAASYRVVLRVDMPLGFYSIGQLALLRLYSG
jgi:hypothetical protein